MVSFDTNASTVSVASHMRATPSYEDQVRHQISVIAKAATPEEMTIVNDMLDKATSGNQSVDIRTVTPAIAANLFINANDRNRAWRARKSESRARQMQRGEWRTNGQAIQFYDTGALADGQHRLGGVALSGVTVKMSFFYGLGEKDIVTVDDGTRRSASDAMALEGETNAKFAEDIVKSVNSYELKLGVDGVTKLESNTEIRLACLNDKGNIAKAIDIGTRSLVGISNPILTEKEAARVAYLLVKSGWDADDLASKLAHFQTGQDTNESAPMFRVSSVITKAKAKKNASDRLTTQAQMGLVVKAFTLVKKGVGAVQGNTFKDVQAGKEIPNPRIA
jgi:hypothetical protein